MPTSRVKQETQLKPKEQRAIATRIRDRMHELGWTVGEVFGTDSKLGRANVGRQTWYSYESARRPMPMDVLRHLEQVLYLPAGELLKMAGWLPAGVEDFAREPGAVLVALEVDPDLTAEEKESLRLIYQGFVAKPRRGRRASRSVT